MMRMPRILFVTYGGGHVNVVLPLIRRIQAEGWAEPLVVGLTTAAAVLRREGIPHFGFKDFLEPGDADALAEGDRLVAELPAGGTVDTEESRAYLGISYHELVEASGREEAERLYRDQGRIVFLPRKYLARILDRLRPDLVVATNSPRAEQAALEVAEERGLPSLCIKDHLGVWEMDRLARPGFGGRLCVFSESVKREIVARGRPADEITVTGNPDFDHLLRPGLAEEGRQLRRERGWDDLTRVIVWASHTWPARPEMPQQIEQGLLEANARHPEWRLVIRRHPSEPPLDAPLPPRVLSSGREEDLATLLMASDLVVTMLSTVGLQARLLGKRMMSIILPTETPDVDLYHKHGLATRYLTDLAPLERSLVEALAEPESFPTGFPTLGAATDNVLTVIRAELGRRPRA